MMADIEQRIAQLEAESQIRQLIARYCFTIDDRDYDGIAALFTDDAVVRSADGMMNAAGRDAIMKQYEDRFKVLGPGQHFMHDVVLDICDGDEARGRVSGHAELWRRDQMMVAGLRYSDRYRRTDKGWLFADREICFLYYVALEDYPGILGKTNRNQAYDTPQPADFPESLSTWAAYQHRFKNA
jgi:uncharacterized protein (TIGR02246 family)